jgi:hypothetical protein
MKHAPRLKELGLNARNEFLSALSESLEPDRAVINS